MRVLRLILVAAFAVLALHSVTPGTPAQAQSGPLRVTADRAQIELPKNVRFHLEAGGDARIGEVKIEYGTEAAQCGGNSATIAVPEFQAGTQVSVDYEWDVEKSSASLPPGARIWWRWHLRDAAGNTLVTERQDLTAEDTRFAWQTASEGPLTLHWYDGSRDFAQQLLDSGTQGLARLARDTGVTITETAHIYIYGDTQSMADVVLYAPSWIGGVAYPEHNVVLIGVAPSQLDWGLTTVKHELTHLVVGHLTFNCLVQLPTWLNEGLAVYAQGDLDADSQRVLDEAIRSDTLDSVRALSASFSAHPERASLAYAESFSLVDFLIKQYGQKQMLALLRTFTEGNASDEALKAVYAFDSDGLEDAWRAAIGAKARSNAGATPARPTATPIPTLPPLGGASTPGGATALPATPVAQAPSATPCAVSTPCLAPTEPGVGEPGVLPTMEPVPTRAPQPAAPVALSYTGLAAAGGLCASGVLVVIGVAVVLARRSQHS